MNAAPDTRQMFEARLRAIGDERYHDKHPFHQMLHSGGCTPDQVRAWVIKAARKLEVVARSRVRSMAITPAVDGDILYLPTQRELFALSLE